MREGLPGRVFFQGLRGEVVAASGPWQTSGEWWQDSWDQSEWDVEIQFTAESQNTQALYRIYYDHLLEKWWVRGVYD